MKNTFEYIKRPQSEGTKNRKSPTFAASDKGKALKREHPDTIDLTLGEVQIPKENKEWADKRNWPQFRDEANKRAAAGDKLYQLATEDTMKYPPTDGTPELRRAAAHVFTKENGIDVSAEDVAISLGGKGGLNGLGSAFVAEDVVLVSSAGWPTNHDLWRDGVHVVEVDTNGRGLMTPKQLEQALIEYPEAKAILINDPCNPTGARYSESEREEIMDMLNKHRAAQHHGGIRPIVAIMDDPYGSLNYDGTSLKRGDKERTLFNEGGLAVVNSVSKVYASPGLRTGWVVTKNKDLLAEVKAYNANIGLSATIAQQNEAQLALLFGDPFIEESKARFAKRAQKLADIVKIIPGLSMEVPKGAIYGWINVRGLNNKEVPADATLNKKGFTLDKPADVAEFFRQAARVATVDGEPFYAPRSPAAKDAWFVRVVLADEKTLEQAFDRIKTAIGKLQDREVGWNVRVQAARAAQANEPRSKRPGV